MARRDGFHDDGDYYERWRGKRRRMADVITAAEVELLDEVVAPLQELYDGPALGSEHVYPAARAMKMHAHVPPDWLIEQRRLERVRAWLERDLWHARAMALDQGARELRRYRPAAGEAVLARRGRGGHTFGLIFDCRGCSHRGNAIIPADRPLPWKLRCSQCGELSMVGA
jgi:hypothetical protein